MIFDLDAYVRHYTAFFSWTEMKAALARGYQPTINTRHYPRWQHEQKAFREAILAEGYDVFSDGVWHRAGTAARRPDDASERLDDPGAA